MADEDEAAADVELDPSKWDEQPAMTGRPNDTPLRGEDKPAVPNSTLAERATARKKAVGTAQNKSVSSEDTETKAPAKRTRKKVA